jgi:RNA polymerase sigma-70 factor, ECF subfamily
VNGLVDVVAAGEAQSGADLIRCIMAGDRKAEAELVRRYNRGIAFIIRREVSDAAAADDLYQETFRIALEKIRRGDVRELEKLSGFMCGLARNLVISHFRRGARGERVTGLEETRPLPDPAPSQFEELLQKEKAAIVRRVINDLPTERDREVLFRFYIAEEGKEQICADLGLDGLHFNRVLFRARQRYKELYEKALSQR